MTPGLDFCVCHHPASIPCPSSNKHISVFELCPLFIVVAGCPALSYCQADIFTLNGTFPPSLFTSSSELPLSVSVSVHPTLILQCCCLCYIFLRLSVLSCAMCLAASESVLLRQLFRSKLTQTGSLVPTAQGRAGSRGPKAALLLYKMPSASLVTAGAIPSKPQRSLDLTRVQFIKRRQPPERPQNAH